MMNVNYLVDDCYLYIPDVYETVKTHHSFTSHNYLRIQSCC